MQPKEPFVQVRAFEELLQPESPPPKKFVVEASVAKRFVVVALVVVLITKVAFWKVD